MKSTAQVGPILTMIGGLGLAGVTLYDMLALHNPTALNMFTFGVGSAFFVRGVVKLSTRRRAGRGDA